jgi:hypothetical protein
MGDVLAHLRVVAGAAGAALLLAACGGSQEPATVETTVEQTEIVPMDEMPADMSATDTMDMPMDGAAMDPMAPPADPMMEPAPEADAPATGN